MERVVGNPHADTRRVLRDVIGRRYQRTNEILKGVLTSHTSTSTDSAYSDDTDDWQVLAEIQRKSIVMFESDGIM